MGTLVEGDDETVWALLRRCHERAMASCERVVTEIRIDGSGRPVGLYYAADRVDESLGEP